MATNSRCPPQPRQTRNGGQLSARRLSVLEQIFLPTPVRQTSSHFNSRASLPSLRESTLRLRSKIRPTSNLNQSDLSSNNNQGARQYQSFNTTKQQFMKKTPYDLGQMGMANGTMKGSSWLGHHTQDICFLKFAGGGRFISWWLALSFLVFLTRDFSKAF